MALKYKELAELLREQILTGVYSPGALLPTEAQLCQVHHLSRQTVRSALQALAAEGLIARRQGSGSRVLPSQQAPAPTQRTIAIITTNINEYIFPMVIREAEAVFSANNCAAMLYATYNQVAQERRILLSLLSSQNIDGILVEGTKTALPNPNLDLYRKLMTRGIPLVFFHGWYQALVDAVSVIDDNYRGGYQLVEYLAAKGHRNIAGIFKSDDIQGHQRYAGFIDALRDLNLPLDDQRIFWYATEARDIMNTQSSLWLNQVAPILKGCSAVVCYNDQVANTMVNFLLSKNVAIPQQMAVVSFDNSFYSSLSTCRITSLSHGQNNIGRLAAESLIHLLEGKPVFSRLVAWELSEKDSS